MSETTFHRLYKNLNPKQREAVDAIDGPVIVLAGPGTGKTSILTLRIANILRKTDTPPDAILALSFTEAGVRAMRRKLLEILGPRAYEVRIHTFHGLCNVLIKRFPERFVRIIGAEHMEELEQFRIIQTLIDRLPLRHLRPRNYPSYYVPYVIDALRELKRENVGPREFGRLLARVTPLNPPSKEGGRVSGDNERAKRSKELARIYRAYELELQKRRLYDYEDMVMEVVRELEGTTDFKLRLQEEHQYILADEHQDANAAQNRLLELLSDYDDAPNLFIVGDDKQAIFRFQGASLENFRYFQKRFPRARVIALLENYRSQPIVLLAAHSVIRKSARSARTPLLQARAAHAPLSVRIVEAQDERSELAYLVHAVSRRLARGEPASEIAVLVRDNKDSEIAAAALRAAAVPVASHAALNILECPRIDALRKLFAAVCDPASDVLLAPALFLDFINLPLLAVFDVLRNRRGSVLHSLGEAPLVIFREQLLSWHALAKNEGLVESFERIAEESGFLRHALARADAPELLSRYDAFLESAKRFAERDKRAKLQDFLARVAVVESFGSGIFAGERAAGEAVQVMTAHKSKGLEFDTVYILFARDGKWGARRGRELFALPIYPHTVTPVPAQDRERGKIRLLPAGPNAVRKGVRVYSEKVPEDTVEDERRLFYVAMTRARKDIVILFETKGEDGRLRLPSRFVHEIEEGFRSHLSFAHAPVPAALPSARPRAPFLLKDKTYLNALFLERGLSVTHLNNFLECPWKYFFLNLIRFPRAQSAAELYGSAMHAALAAHFNGYAREENKTIAETLAFFEHALRRTHLSLTDFNGYRKSGKAELKGYLSHWTFPRAIWNEYAIGGVPLEIGGQEIELGGKLDKVEMLSDGVVTVVDYKTGAPKTRNEILGKTKNADGNYYRQLVFYKLLLDSAKKPARRGGGWRMKTGTLDFLKPTPSGAYRREVFEIEEREVAELRTLITDVCAQILSLSFFDKGCGEKKCEYCRLRASIA